MHVLQQTIFLQEAVFESNYNIKTINCNSEAIMLNLGSGHNDIVSALGCYVKKEFQLSLEIVSKITCIYLS